MQLLGNSAAMERLRDKIHRIAPTPLPILIQGETGTGKEVVARALHRQSGRPGAFVAVDCGALSQSLVETELFGHERGAFTGANHHREGLVSAARDGTFFLDEVGELPIQAQTRLLRLLENGTYRPVGSSKERVASVRVVAATWRDLRAQVEKGLFRSDLYHRLAIVELLLPPLRDRSEDIELLFVSFLREAVGGSRVPPVLESTTRSYLRSLRWKGNIRELRNTAQYVAAMCTGRHVRIEDLPPGVQTAASAQTDGVVAQSVRAIAPTLIRIDLPYMEARRVFLDDFQRRYVEAQLAACDGNISAAARAAGMDRRSIQRILTRTRSELLID